MDELADALKPCITGRVLLEATTLGLAEIALCCRALKELSQDAFDIVYVEPQKYTQPSWGPLLHKRDFELSSEVPGYQAIPGSGLFLRDRKPFRSVFFIGYEDARLRRAFEELQMVNPQRSSITIGVPAFKAGWEMSAMANNISVIREYNIRGGVHYCGADDPYAVYELLCQIYQGLERVWGERLVLAPIGTKPHGIGVALFASMRHDVGIIYDHPNRTNKRSEHVGHLAFVHGGGFPVIAVTRHDTPAEVATSLARHAPRRIRALLDPAVGGGNLIAPLVNRLKRQDSSVHCVDSDRETVKEVREHFGTSLPSHARFIHSDFLTWSASPEAPKFDCIVMNPPFAASRSSLCRLDPRSGEGGVLRLTRYMPLEAAFVCRAIDLLENDGRLLAVLPCSVVMSESLQWLRDALLSQGAIRFVHELPPRTFPAVESRMYLMVFDKGKSQRQIALLNHDLHEPERLQIGAVVGSVLRLDFGYANANIFIGRLKCIESLKFTALSELAEVIRGDIKSPLGARVAVHTTDYREGYWRPSHRHDRSAIRSGDRTLKRGDILISRVGRNAHLTCSVGVRLIGMACSDCVLIVRLTRLDQGLKVLFAMKVVLSQGWIRPLLMRGTGASYISHRSLLDLPIPMGASEAYPLEFTAFSDGVRTRSTAMMSSAVAAVSPED